ncbi:MAG: hypothetical protein ACKOGA_20310, partial [Planctomycetaceae bacterium]
HPAGQGGLYLYVPGQWAMVNIDLGNSTDREAEITCATFFESEKSLQYGRKVWVPPGAKLKVSHPILVPRPPDDEQPHFSLSKKVAQVISASRSVEFPRSMLTIAHCPGTYRYNPPCPAGCTE